LVGTNTYVIGRQNPFTLVDTGEGREEYIPVLESCLRETAKPCNPTEPDISDIIISHWHHDHVGGLPSVLALLRRLWEERNSSLPFTPPRLHKFPLPSQTPDSKLPSILDSLPSDSFTRSAEGTHFHDLHDSQTFPLTSPEIEGTKGSIHVLHTPGHTSDSICLYIPEDQALYTADTVLGQGTAVFDELAAYIASLRKMLDFGSNTSSGQGMPYRLLYPGHGPVVSDGPALIGTYIKHRMEREDQIIQVLKSSTLLEGQSTPEPQPPWTTWTIVSKIYSGYPQSLWLPAAHSVDLHLRKLEQEGRVKRLDGDGVNVQWVLF